MQTYFNTQIVACREREAVLNADGREDEAVFEKVRANVYGIFQTVWTLNKDTEFFREKLETIPQNWQAAREKAEKHGDTAAVTLETIKLETAQEILEHWEAVR